MVVFEDFSIFYVEMDSGSCVLARSVRTLQDGSVVTVGVKCLRHAEMLVPVVTLSWQCTGLDMAFILISRCAKSTGYCIMGPNDGLVSQVGSLILEHSGPQGKSELCVS